MISLTEAQRHGEKRRVNQRASVAPWLREKLFKPSIVKSIFIQSSHYLERNSSSCELVIQGTQPGLRPEPRIRLNMKSMKDMKKAIAEFRAS